MLVKGTSEKHLKENLRKHKEGNKHKEIMKLKKSDSPKKEREEK